MSAPEDADRLKDNIGSNAERWLWGETVRRADPIEVLDRGTVVECETHEPLVALDGTEAYLVHEAARPPSCADEIP